MIKKIFALSLLTLFSLNVTANAASCLEDSGEMRDQIQQYGSITTKSGQYRFDRITQVKGDSTCQADGYYFGRFICPVTWNMTDWGNTLSCA